MSLEFHHLVAVPSGKQGRSDDAALLASDGARGMTGNIAYVDAGMHMMR